MTLSSASLPPASMAAFSLTLTMNQALIYLLYNLPHLILTRLSQAGIPIPISQLEKLLLSG